MLKKIKLSNLKIATYNPRETDKATLDKLKNSIKEFGYLEPIVYNERSGNIIGGHSRYAVLKELYGEDHEIEAVALDLDDHHEKTLNIALNKIKGEWDEDKLNKILKDMEPNLVELSGFKKDPYKDEKKLNLKEDEDLIREELSITFWFDDEEERNKIKSFFENKNEDWNSNAPNVNLLKKIIESHVDEKSC